MSLELALAGVKAIAGVAAASQQLSIAKSMQKQARQLALRTEALSQREAIERMREMWILASRARAMAAASGAGVDDPSVLNEINKIEAKGEFDMLAALYDGKVQANYTRYEAQLGVKTAKQNMKGAMVSSIADMGTSFYKKGDLWANRPDASSVPVVERSIG